MTLISPVEPAYQVPSHLRRGLEESAWSSIAIGDTRTIATRRVALRIRPEARKRDPLRIVRFGVWACLVGLAMAVPAALLSAGLAFLVAFCSVGVLLLSLLGFWRESGQAILSPGMLFVMILFTCALAATSGVAAVVDLVG